MTLGMAFQPLSCHKMLESPSHFLSHLRYLLLLTLLPPLLPFSSTGQRRVSKPPYEAAFATGSSDYCPVFPKPASSDRA